MDLAVNNTNLQEPFNTDEPLEILYTRLNECVKYAAAAGKPVTEGQVLCIAYGLVAETGQFKED